MADTEVPTCKDFHVAIICALSLEADVVEELFDYKWETSEILPEFEDGSKLTLGRIEKHLVVLVWIGGMGKTKAGLAAASMEKNFKSVKYVMVVGICGGVPFIKDYEKKCEILLGDVIISTAIHKYDEGKVTERQKYVANTPFIPNKKEVFGNFLDIVKSRRHKRAEHTQRLREECANNLLNLLKILTSKGYADVQYPGWKSDKLYQTNHLHKHYDSSKCGECAGGKEVCELVNTEPCESLGCGDQNIIPRERLKELDLNGRTSPEVFFGPIGSGDKVVRSGKYRDDLAKNERIIGIEMEGPGVCEVFDQVVVIKSVCDYADSHKSKEWQPHAAATAAACAKAFLKLHGKKITQWETKKDHKISGMKSIIFKDHAPKPQPASSNSKPQTDREDPPEVKEFTLRDEDDTPLRAQTHPKAYDGQHRPNPHAQYHGYPPPPEVYSPPLPGMYKPPPPGMYNFQNPQQYQDYRSNFPLYRQHIYYPVQNPFEPIGPMTPPTSPPTPHGNIGLNETPTSQEPSAQARELHSPPMLLPEPSPSTWKDAQEDLKEGERVFSTASKTVVVVDSATHKPLGVMSYSVREIAGPTTPAISTGTLAQAVSQTNTLPSISPEPVATKEVSEQTKALLKACQAQDFETVRKILEVPSQIDTKAVNDKTKTMLQLALGTSKANTVKSKMIKIGKIVRALCEAGAEVEKMDIKSGSAPIHVCAKTMNCDAAMALLDHGADANLKDKSGRTALYHIAVDNDPDIGFVQSLLKRGGTLGGKKLPQLQDRPRGSQIETRKLISRCS